MDSLKKLSVDVMEKGLPDAVIAELLDCCGTSVYIIARAEGQRYHILYNKSLSKFYVRHAGEEGEEEDKPIRSPGLLMDTDALLAFIELFCGFTPTYRGELRVCVLGAQIHIRDKEEFLAALQMLRGIYEVS